MFRAYFKNPIRMPLYLYAAILLILVLPSVFVSGRLIHAVYACAVLQKSEFQYIVIAGQGDYIRLEEYYLADGNLSLDAELYLPEEGAKPSGYFAFNDRLQPSELPHAGECFVSRALAQRSRVKIGDTLALKSYSIGREEVQVKITGYLPSLNGNKPDAAAKGLILLGRDDKIMPSDGDARISFIREVSFTADELLYKSVMQRQLRKQIVFCFLWTLLPAAIGIMILETVFQRGKLRDYRYFYRKGMRRGRLAALIALELIMKYVPVMFVAGLTASLVYAAPYGAAAFVYLGITAACGTMGLILSAAYHCIGSYLWIR